MERTYISIIESLPGDFELVHVDGGRFSVSRVVLSGFSPVFATMLNSPMGEATSKQILIEDFPEVTVKNLIDFMYGRLDFEPLDDMELFSLVQIMDKYEIDNTIINKEVLKKTTNATLVNYIKSWHDFSNSNKELLEGLLGLIPKFHVHNMGVRAAKVTFLKLQHIQDDNPGYGAGLRVPSSVFKQMSDLIEPLVVYHNVYADKKIIRTQSEKPKEIDGSSDDEAPVEHTRATYAIRARGMPTSFHSLDDFFRCDYMNPSEVLHRLDLLYLEIADMDELLKILTIESYRYLFEQTPTLIVKESPAPDCFAFRTRSDYSDVVVGPGPIDGTGFIMTTGTGSI